MPQARAIGVEKGRKIQRRALLMSGARPPMTALPPPRLHVKTAIFEGRYFPVLVPRLFALEDFPHGFLHHLSREFALEPRLDELHVRRGEHEGCAAQGDEGLLDAAQIGAEGFRIRHFF